MTRTCLTSVDRKPLGQQYAFIFQEEQADIEAGIDGGSLRSEMRLKMSREPDLHKFVCHWVSWFHSKWDETSKDYEERNYRNWLFSSKQYFWLLNPVEMKRDRGRSKQNFKRRWFRWGMMVIWSNVGGKFWASGFMFQTEFPDKMDVPCRRSGIKDWKLQCASVKADSGIVMGKMGHMFRV